LITGHKKCPKNDRSNTGRFGIRWVSVSSFHDKVDRLYNLLIGPDCTYYNH
jgi:hypothetical protein